MTSEKFNEVIKSINLMLKNSTLRLDNFHKKLKNLKNKHFNVNIVKLSLWQVLMNGIM